jgi:pimeloyl-ACP methyl ester carboxylesterase
MIAAPVLLITRERDPIWPLAALAGLIPHFAAGRMAVLPGAGHAPYFEEPATFNALIAEFLDLTI